MKKILFILLLMIPFAINADCDINKWNDQNKLASNITYDGVFYKDTMTYTIVFYNVYNGMYLSYNNDIYNPDSQNEVTISGVKQGEYAVILVNSALDNCTPLLRTINITLGYYNTLRDSAECASYVNKLSICTDTYLSYEPTVGLRKSMIDNYNKTLSSSEEKKVEDEEETILDSLKSFTDTWGIPIILVLVVSLITAAIFRSKFSKIQHGI